MLSDHDLTFYSSAAQIIPIIALAAAIETRVMSTLLASGRGLYPAALGVVAATVVGEVAALRVLDTGRATFLLHAMLVVALVILGTNLMMCSLGALLVREVEDPAERQERINHMGLIAVCVSIVGVLVCLVP